MPGKVTPVSWLEAPDWLTETEAARLAGLTVEAVRWLVADGSLDAQGLGGDLRIEKASLSEWLDALEDLAYMEAAQAEASAEV